MPLLAGVVVLGATAASVAAGAILADKQKAMLDESVTKRKKQLLTDLKADTNASLINGFTKTITSI
jgi:ABC-type oligopeptide transport system ATPase subunit